MRKLGFVLVGVIALWVLALPFAYAVEVPAVSPLEFAAPAATAATTAAHWVWSLLISDTVTDAVLWLLEGGVAVLLGWLGLTGSRVARCVLYIAAAVREVFVSFVRPAKLASADGKLTERARLDAMDQAIERAKELARDHGLDLFKYLSKEVVAAVAEYCVRLFKGDSKKTAVAVPLPDLAP